MPVLEPQHVAKFQIRKSLAVDHNPTSVVQIVAKLAKPADRPTVGNSPGTADYVRAL